MHMLRYGTSAPDERAEIVSLRVTVTGLMRKPPQEKIKRGRERRPPKSAFAGKRPVSFDGKLPSPTPTYRRAELLRRQPDQRPGADRGTRLDHGADAAATAMTVDASAIW